MANAYWILPKNEVEESAVIEVKAKHIDTVIDNPEIFGMTYDEISQTYKKYNEKLRFEGFAREEIVIALIMKGYIHIRKNKKTDCWRITTINSLSDTKKVEQCTIRKLTDWYKLVSRNKEHKFSDFEIFNLEGESRYFAPSEFKSLYSY